jgi:hypothetical protein
VEAPAPEFEKLVNVTSARRRRNAIQENAALNIFPLGVDYMHGETTCRIPAKVPLSKVNVVAADVC